MDGLDLALSIGSNIKLLITDLTSEGNGVGRINNIAVFVEGALPGETVNVTISGVKKNYLTAGLAEIALPSLNRQEPFCPVFEKCGGCTLQHMSYEYQVEYKKKKVKDAIERISGLKNIPVNDVIRAKEDKGYRNKIQFFFDYGNNEVNCGFFGKKSHAVINNENCFLINDTINKLKNELVNFIKKNISGFYNVQRNTAIIKSVIIRQAFKTHELMLIIITTEKIAKESMDLFLLLVENLMDKIPELKSIYYSINADPKNFMIQDKPVLLMGTKSITEIISDLKFKISPSSFFQVNPVQAEKLYNKIIELADLKINEVALDLFCGTGTIGLFLAKKEGKVIGVDITKSAMDDAYENARINNIKTAEFISGDVVKVLESYINDNANSPADISEINKIDTIIVDPPRDGLGEKLVSLISKLNPEKIIYASCNSATLARDLKTFNDFSYSTEEIQPIDMFPHTEHVECVAMIERK